MNPPKVSWLLLIASFMVGGCSPSIPQSEQIASATRTELSALPDGWQTVVTQGQMQDGWIKAFGDPMLVALTQEALNHNRNLQSAAIQVERARLLATQAGAALAPNVDLVLGMGRSGNLQNGSTQTSNLSLGLQVGWEIDLWGRIRSGAAAAAAGAQAAQADYRFAEISLAANTAKAYFAAIESDLQRALFQKRLVTLEETLRIVKVRYENGLTSRQDYALAQSDVALARERLVGIENAKRDAIRALEMLLGRYPAAELALGASLPDLPPPPSAGLPSELLERRPDMVAVERRVAEAFNFLDQAKAARLPVFSLTSNIGGASSALSDLLNPQNVAWRLAGNLLAPIFDAGRRQTRVELATQDQQQALNDYGNAALQAFRQVEAALDQRVALEKRELHQRVAQEQAEHAYRIAMARYAEGEIALLELLTLQERVDGAASSLKALNRLRLENWVDLNLALGGNWN